MFRSTSDLAGAFAPGASLATCGNGGGSSATQSADDEAGAKDTLVKLWTQIATRLRDYDHHLVFEMMNEPRVAPNGVDDRVGKAGYYDVLKRTTPASA